MYKLLTALLLTLVLTGCMEKQLEWRNVQVSNGMVFERDANDPFTGLVYNVPADRIVVPDNDFATPFFNYLRNSGRDDALPIIDLARATCQAQIKDGRRHGYLECYRQDDTLLLEMKYKNGGATGTVYLYDRNEDDYGNFEI